VCNSGFFIPSSVFFFFAMKNCQKETLIQNFGENSFSFNNKLPCFNRAFYYYWGSMSGQVSILAALEMLWTELLTIKSKSVWGWLLDYKIEKKLTLLGLNQSFFFGRKISQNTTHFSESRLFCHKFWFSKQLPNCNRKLFLLPHSCLLPTHLRVL